MKNMDLGGVTKEEFDDWYYNEMQPNSNDDNFEPRGGAFRHCETATKLKRCLSTKDFDRFLRLFSIKKAITLGLIDEDDEDGDDVYWTDGVEEEFKQLQQKILLSSQSKRDEIRRDREFEPVENSVELAHVRHKTTGKIGHCQPGVDGMCTGDRAGRGEHLVAFNDGTMANIPRKELDVLCRRCDNLSNQRCTRCKQVWYCGRDCQIQDWKEQHKKECKEKVYEEMTATKTGGGGTAATAATAAASDDKVHACAYCETKAEQCCSQCKQVWYCGSHCQRLHWKIHKKECKNIMKKKEGK